MTTGNPDKHDTRYNVPLHDNRHTDSLKESGKRPLNKRSRRRTNIKGTVTKTRIPWSRPRKVVAPKQPGLQRA